MPAAKPVKKGTLMKKIVDLHQVDAFTNQLFGGNPSGVVTNADGLSEAEMRSIAREMNLSETAFVLQPTVSHADIKLRYFTPEAEITFCGHATIAALYELARLQMHGVGSKQNNRTMVETNAEVLAMAATIDDAGQPAISFTAPQVRMAPYQLQGIAFATALGIPSEALADNCQILVDTALNYIYIPVATVDRLNNLVFDFTQIKAYFKAEGIVVFCLFAKDPDEPAVLHARGLAPLVGVNEDPFTGSMQAAMIHAAKQNRLLDTAQETVITKQGGCIGRPGFATVNHDLAKGQITVTASAVQVFSTELELSK